MKQEGATILISLIARKSSVAELNFSQWCGVVALSRQLGFLPFLYHKAVECEVLNNLPRSIFSQLKSAHLEQTKQQDSVKWHIQQLSENNPSQIKVALLKGAAYILAKKRNANYRLLSDVDLLVNKEKLDDAEFWLFINGFACSTSDEYDDFYYRQWMHELPPFVSAKSGMVVDLHHNILPISSKRYINARNIFKRGMCFSPNFFIPCDEDLIIHSAVHLIQDSVFNRTLRDLSDQYWLISDYIADNGGLEGVLNRAVMLGLAVDVAKVISLMHHVLDRSLSSPEKEFVAKHAGTGLLWPIEQECYVIMLKQPVLSEWTLKHRLASLYLFIKSHLIKMPIGLLFKHTIIKTSKRLSSLFDDSENTI